jgi:hypothetical protein
MVIQVEQRHIDRARTLIEATGLRCPNCPVALAITEALGFPVKVIGPEYYIGMDRYPLPDSVAKWICEFDQGGPVKPFDFEITCEKRGT